MGRSLRLVLRFSCLMLGTAGLTCLLLLGWPLARLMKRQVAWRSWSMRQWGRWAVRCLAIRVRSSGPAPEGAYLMVCNHLGYVDIPVLASQTGCRLVSKAEVRQWPVVGPLARLAGTVFVDRGRRRDVVRVGGEMGAAVAEGCGLVFFPEGTSTRGAGVDPFRSSLLQPAAEAQLPVHFATLRYSTPEGEVPAEMSVAWWGDMELAPHLLDLLRLPSIEAELIFGEQPIVASDRKLLAEELHAAVSGPFVPMHRSPLEAATGL